MSNNSVKSNDQKILQASIATSAVIPVVITANLVENYYLYAVAIAVQLACIFWLGILIGTKRNASSTH